MLKRLNHVGIVVEDLDRALQTYVELLGFALLERRSLAEHQVDVAFLEAHNSTVELIAPTDPESGTAKFLRNRGEGTHHLCYEVDDIDQVLQELQSRGMRLIDQAPRQGVHGLVAFVHPKATHGVMIELLQLSDTAVV